MNPRVQNIKEFFKKNEKSTLLTVSFVSIFFLGFFAGKLNADEALRPVITIEKAPIHSSILKEAPQLVSQQPVCKIKGSSSKVYHLPGGAFYERTKAAACFETEEQAVAAGYRKSTR